VPSHRSSRVARDEAEEVDEARATGARGARWARPAAGGRQDCAGHGDERPGTGLQHLRRVGTAQQGDGSRLQPAVVFRRGGAKPGLHRCWPNDSEAFSAVEAVGRCMAAILVPLRCLEAMRHEMQHRGIQHKERRAGFQPKGNETITPTEPAPSRKSRSRRLVHREWGVRKT
jgi:hypothetical protein